MSWTTTAFWVALGLFASAIAAPAPASAADTAAPDEAVSTGSGEAPTPEPGDVRDTIDPGGVWFTRDEPDAAPGRCTPPEDRKPHGQVWGSVGSHDYRAGGVSVEMPVGDCARVAVEINGSKGGYATPYGYGPYAPYAEPRVGAPIAPGRWIQRED